MEDLFFRLGEYHHCFSACTPPDFAVLNQYVQQSYSRVVNLLANSCVVEHWALKAHDN